MIKKKMLKQLQELRESGENKAKIKELEKELLNFEKEDDPEYGQNYVRISYEKDRDKNKDTKDLEGFNFKENFQPKRGVKFS